MGRFLVFLTALIIQVPEFLLVPLYIQLRMTRASSPQFPSPHQWISDYVILAVWIYSLRFVLFVPLLEVRLLKCISITKQHLSMFRSIKSQLLKSPTIFNQPKGEVYARMSTTLFEQHDAALITQFVEINQGYKVLA